MPDPTQPRRCTCKGRQCGTCRTGIDHDTCRIGVICEGCWARLNAKAQQKQHRTPAMVDTFEDCALFGERK
jgi:hypothetical protein